MEKEGDMMKALFSLALILILTSALAFAQAGPKQKEKPKPKKETNEQTNELQPGERLQADTTETELEEVKIEAAKTKEPVRSAHLKRAIFTTGIVQHEPVDDVDSLSTATERIYFFTEIAGLQGKTIRHRWIHNNQVLAEIPIAIGGPNWRVYSSKKFLPEWTGEWTVLVVDEDENVLGKKSLIYYPARSGE
jgi:hypothetical protein